MNYTNIRWVLYFFCLSPICDRRGVNTTEKSAMGKNLVMATNNHHDGEYVK